MAKLIYPAICSLDGFIADEHGGFDWAVPDEEVHAFVNELERPVGTYLYGRRMYEMMAAWDRDDTLPGLEPVTVAFAEVWRAARKVVYSRTLESVSTARTQLEREFDADAVRRMKDAAEKDLTVSGPDLAAHAFAAGLVDECQLFLVPIAVGGGTPAMPRGVRVPLELAEQRRFAGGTVYLRYTCVPAELPGVLP